MDGGGKLVKHFSYPKPSPAPVCVNSDNLDQEIKGMETMMETQVWTSSDNLSGPGPMALIQFRIWESGRLDFEKLTGCTTNNN